MVNRSLSGSGGGAAGIPCFDADGRDAWLVERQAGAGAAALLVEDRGDLLIAGVRGELADQLDRVLAGAVALGPALDQRHGQLGPGAAFPDDLHLGTARLLVDRDDHLGDQRAQQLLAVAGGRRVGRPEAREVADQPGERLALSLGERFGAAGLELGELASFALELRQRGLQPGFERAGDEPVLGLARVELALRAAGFELGPLDREPLAGQALLVLALELADRLRAGAARRPG